MSTRARIATLFELVAAFVIFLFAQMSLDGNRGGTMDVETKRLASACSRGNRCLPDVPWRDTTGVTYSSADLAGKVVVVNFWATWCHPCEREIPDFARVATRYVNRAVLLGVMMDSPRPDESTVLNFMSDHDMTYPVIPVTRDIQLAFHYPYNYPTTYVFDRNGNQRTWKIHPMSEGELSGIIEAILHE